jgi:hypothetical protein
LPFLGWIVGSNGGAVVSYFIGNAATNDTIGLSLGFLGYFVFGTIGSIIGVTFQDSYIVTYIERP